MSREKMQEKERERAKKTHLILNKLSKVAGRTEKGPHEGREGTGRGWQV